MTKAPGRTRSRGERISLPPAKPSIFGLSESGTGFRVRLADNVATPPGYARMRVAYDVPKGNPLARYKPTDFRLRGAGALEVKIEGGKLESGPRDGETLSNELYVSISDPRNFSVSVQGFDSNRDVYVRVDEVSTGEDEGP